MYTYHYTKTIAYQVQTHTTITETREISDRRKRETNNSKNKLNVLPFHSPESVRPVRPVHVWNAHIMSVYLLSLSLSESHNEAK